MRKLICILVTLLISVAVQAQPEAFPSTYGAPAGQPVLFKNATILTGDGRRLGREVLVAELVAHRRAVAVRGGRERDVTWRGAHRGV